MINTGMRLYDYFLFGEEDGYGVPTLSEKKGSIKANINISSQQTQDNILYKDCTYTLLSLDYIDDSFVISYGDSKLKVMYVNPIGRYNQAFMKEIFI